MSLTNYKPQFDNAYQEVFQKALVAKDIMNTRFEATLKYGGTVERVKFDISGVRVRATNRNGPATIDSISDTNEVLTVNLEYEADFYISDGEVTQAGPLNPGEEIGKQIGIKVALDLDARCFGQVVNALFNFDNGDLTSLVSSGVPITLSATNVPLMVTRMPAKLRYKNNQEIIQDMVFVIDSYAAADVANYLLGKQFDLVEYVLKNGYTGDVSNAQMYISENLTGAAILTMGTTPTAGDTVTIDGIVFTAQTTLTPLPGEFLISGSAANANTNFAALINAPSVTTTYGVALTPANYILLQDQLRLVATPAAASTTIVGTGSGRLILASSLTTTANLWTGNHIKGYFGKRGAIDLVIQDMKPVDMRPTSDRRGTNVFSSYLAGLFTFADGAKKFLAVLIAT